MVQTIDYLKEKKQHLGQGYSSVAYYLPKAQGPQVDSQYQENKITQLQK